VTNLRDCRETVVEGLAEHVSKRAFV